LAKMKQKTYSWSWIFLTMPPVASLSIHFLLHSLLLHPNPNHENLHTSVSLHRVTCYSQCFTNTDYRVQNCCSGWHQLFNPQTQTLYIYIFPSLSVCDFCILSDTSSARTWQRLKKRLNWYEKSFHVSCLSPHDL
jgi:hypothetical protein